MPQNLSRDVAEAGRRRREGRAGTDAALAGKHDAGHLPAVCPGVSEESSRQAHGSASVTNGPVRLSHYCHKTMLLFGATWTEMMNEFEQIASVESSPEKAGV